MKALTLIQPWATAIIRHGKNLENRPWHPPDSMIGERIAIHAGKKVDKKNAWGLQHDLDIDLTKVPTSGIIGTAVIAGYYTFYYTSEWTIYRAVYEGEPVSSDIDIRDNRWLAEGTKHAWVLRDVVALPTPIPCAGALGLWRVPVEHLSALEARHA